MPGIGKEPPEKLPSLIQDLPLLVYLFGVKKLINK
jgi:hypothetical protein